MKPSLLEVKDWSLSFVGEDGSLPVILGLDLTVEPGEIVAMVGSSGAGKSLLAHSILGILPSHALEEGTLLYQGEALTAEKKKAVRGKEIALIPQSLTYFDPHIRIGKQVRGNRSSQRKKRQQEAFHRLGLESSVEEQYPFELSGGMARRALFSTALMEPYHLIIADEPTPGMDTKSAIEALTMLRELAQEGAGVLLITHDIQLALGIAQKVVILYSGVTVEETSATAFSGTGELLAHPYSYALWQSLPENQFLPLAGTPPYPGTFTGCPFASRCSWKTTECEKKLPPIRKTKSGKVRCYYDIIHT